MTASLASLASKVAFNIKERTSYVAIQELTENDEKYRGESLLKFQYFPDTISDSKSINWTSKDIPGGSLPIYQWVSSGERSISFTAIFTTDTDFSDEGGTVVLYERLNNAGYSGRNVDIKTAVLWLRRFMLPRYGDPTSTGAPLTTAPRKLQLHIPNSGIGWAGGKDNIGAVDRDFITCIMNQCDVTWVQFFPSGAPRIAEVQLGFLQVAQFRSRISFPFTDSNVDDLVYGSAAAPNNLSKRGYLIYKVKK